jgi:hypothetical protein
MRYLLSILHPAASQVFFLQSGSEGMQQMVLCLLFRVLEDLEELRHQNAALEKDIQQLAELLNQTWSPTKTQEVRGGL